MENIKKYIAVMLVCVFALFTMVGCNNVNKSTNYSNGATDSKFTLISSESRMSIYIKKM